MSNSRVETAPRDMIIASSTPHDLSYWALHPMVVRVEERPTDRLGEIQVAIYLTSTLAECPAQPSEATAVLDRPVDIELNGSGPLHETFWHCCPNLEHIQIDEEQDSIELNQAVGWNAKLWINRENNKLRLLVLEMDPPVRQPDD